MGVGLCRHPPPETMPLPLETHTPLCTCQLGTPKLAPTVVPANLGYVSFWGRVGTSQFCFKFFETHWQKSLPCQPSTRSKRPSSTRLIHQVADSALVQEGRHYCFPLCILIKMKPIKAASLKYMKISTPGAARNINRSKSDSTLQQKICQLMAFTPFNLLQLAAI